MLGVALLVFPRLALGLSGFETGVSLMPLVRGDEGDDPERPTGRIRNTGKLLTSAALIMSFFLITTTFVTAVLIPLEEFESGGEANVTGAPSRTWHTSTWAMLSARSTT